MADEVAMQGDYVVMREEKVAVGAECCCGDCCDGFPFFTFDSPLSSNYVEPVCCAYLYWLDPGSKEVVLPVGATGPWPGVNSSLGTDTVTSTCGRAYYLDWVAAGEPPESPEPPEEPHPHWTTTQRSVVMTYAGAVFEVFLDGDCCPVSLQVDNSLGSYPEIADAELRFGPETIANFFDVSGHDLFICEGDAPTGACCIDGFGSIGTGYLEFYCETVGDGMIPGTWYEDGTYDPEDPCNPLP